MLSLILLLHQLLVIVMKVVSVTDCTSLGQSDMPIKTVIFYKVINSDLNLAKA